MDNIKRRLDEKKGFWADELPGVLWAYRTTPHSATGETPFALAFGVEAVVPAEVGIPSLRRIMAPGDEEANEENLLHQLDHVGERREQASTHIANYQNMIARHYNKKVRSRRFNVGQMVLRRVFQNTVELNSGKLGQSWEGPYIVTNIVRPGFYELKNTEGAKVIRSWNIKHLKKFYQ